MFGPALIHELPVERQFSPGLDFTAEESRRKKLSKAAKKSRQNQVFPPKHLRLIPFLLLQVTAAVVKEEVHVLGQSALNDAGAVVKEVDKLL